MTELSRDKIVNDLVEERGALKALLTRFNDEDWRSLTRSDSWSVHDIVAHIADIHLSTIAISGIFRRPSRAKLGVTLPMTPNGHVNVERLNMLRYQVNSKLSRAEVMVRLDEAFKIVAEAINALDEDQLSGPGPYGPPETMLGWFNGLILHIREHRLQLEQIYASRS